MRQKISKVRFSKKELERIERSLLAEGEDICAHPTVKDFTPKRSGSKYLLYCFLSLPLLAAIIILTTFFVLRSGFDSEFLRAEAQKNIAQFLSDDSQISVGKARISLDQTNNLAIEATDVALIDAQRGLDIRHINSFKLGLSPLALLLGRIEVKSAEVSGVEISLSDSGKNNNFLQNLPYDSQGRVDFDAASTLVFDGVNEALSLLSQRQTQAIRISDMIMKYPAAKGEETFAISEASIEEHNDAILLKGAFDWHGKPLILDGQINRPNGMFQKFSLKLDGIPVHLGSPPQVKALVGTENRVNPAHFSLSSNASVTLSGQTTNDEQPQKLNAAIKFSDIDLEVGRINDILGQAEFNLELLHDTKKVEILSSNLQLGGVKLKFNGAFGPEDNNGALHETADNANAKNHNNNGYRFEIVTSEAVSAPEQSSEAPLSFAGRVAGRFDIQENRLEFNNLDVKTSDGSLYGQGSLSFGQGSPGIIFLLRVPEMPVAQAKQLWPVDVADGAREWVLKNLFGGQLSNGRIDVAIPPGHFNGQDQLPELTGEEVQVDFDIQNTRLDVIGDLPPLREAGGHIEVRGAHTTINLDKGTSFTPENRQLDVSHGTLFIPWGRQRPVMADLDIRLQGNADAVAEILGKRPINISRHLPFKPADIKGDVTSQVKVSFAVNKDAPAGTYTWNADIDFNGVEINKPIDGQIITRADGKIKVDPKAAHISANALLNNMPAKISMVEPVEDKTVLKQQLVELTIDDKARAALFPDINTVFSGPMVVKLGLVKNKQRAIGIDLKNTEINLPWLGWKKGAGIAAKAELIYSKPDENAADMAIKDLIVSGDGFQIAGDINIDKSGLASADFKKIQLTSSDNLSLKLRRIKDGYGVDLRGSSFDARALIKQLSQGDTESSSKSDSLGKSRIVLNGQIDKLNGFYNEKLMNFAISYESMAKKISSFSVNASTESGKEFVATSNTQNDARSVSLKSSDAGAMLRFFDFYDKVHGGTISVGLAAQGKNPLHGQIDARNFAILGEGRLSSIVSSSPTPGGASLNQAVKRDIDVSRVDIERGYALIEKGEGYANLSKGVIRGPVVGTTFQGTLYDPAGNMNMTGTFMPAYGLNRMFADIPLFGALLGNGRDRGLIGITYKLSGSAKSPKVTVNPISAIAPGIFRTIFEF
ncbi:MULTISPECIES: DUF3971 domain-containing protein [unclassified Paenochrobactrum]|uniref:YhdP family protein n=1 Tax=unclassified Paenochrobactrum TaxID=2639760 RepID=UPI00385720FA